MKMEQFFINLRAGDSSALTSIAHENLGKGVVKIASSNILNLN